jgi:glutamate-ammonia-ligase adenylyltransferase
LVRARCVAGDASLCADFETLREQVLARTRDRAALARDVVDMRRRMRAQLDRSDAARFDLKQGEGGLVDLEFLLQALVLGEATRQPSLLKPRATLGRSPGFQQRRLPCRLAQHQRLQQAHATLVDAGLRCTLDRRPRLAAETEAIAVARTAIRDATRAMGLDFGGG